MAESQTTKKEEDRPIDRRRKEAEAVNKKLGELFEAFDAKHVVETVFALKVTRRDR